MPIKLRHLLDTYITEHVLRTVFCVSQLYKSVIFTIKKREALLFVHESLFVLELRIVVLDSLNERKAFCFVSDQLKLAKRYCFRLFS